jgi:DNA-binding beta-propeller fold protein YncE
VRQPAGIAATADGGLIVGDRRSGQVLQLSPEGTELSRWTVEGLAGVTLDPHGKVYAASDSRIYRLEAGRAPRAVAGLGDFTPISALAVDGVGRFWLLDRRGEAVARLPAGADGPAERWQPGDVKLSDLIWNAGLLVAIDSRNKNLIALTPEFTRESQPGPAFLKPIAVAADPSGRLAVLDSKADAVVFLNRDGSPNGAFDCELAGIDRPTDIDFADDGSFHIFDAARSAWVRLR